MTNRKDIVLDIETDSLDPSLIHVIIGKDLATGNRTIFTKPTFPFVERYLKEADSIIMHNGISFDLPNINRLLNISIPYNKVIDTLILSQLNNPIRPGGNSLENWGSILGFPKLPQPQSFKEFTPQMQNYCQRDVEITEKLYKHLQKEMSQWSQHSIKLEHTVRRLLDLQKINGFYLHPQKVSVLLADLSDQAGILEKELVDIFEPTIVEMKTKTKVIPFNPQSRQQIGDRLIKKGWKPTKFTEKTGHPVVNEHTLKNCPIPEAEHILDYMLKRKRIAQIESWIKVADPVTHRVHGNVITIGAVTTRMSHNSPNMAQVPAVYSPYGKECRECWTVEDLDNYRLVGTDASGLELRCLAHYINDPDYTKEILDGDVHSANQKMAGLPDRASAKTFIYAFLYGAGASKIGAITGKDAKHGQALINRFLSAMPRLSKFRQKIMDEADKTHMLQGLDGRYLHSKNSYSSVNTLLQGAGAIICKEWLCHITNLVNKKGLDAKAVVNVHDEVQFEVHKKDVTEFQGVTNQAIKLAEQTLDIKCPLDSESKVGLNWAETH